MAKLNSLSDLKSLFPEAEGTYQPEIKHKKQQLEAHFSNKGRGGKTVTIIKGFDGSESSAVEISICAVDIPVVVFPLVAFSISAVLKISAFAVA